MAVEGRLDDVRLAPVLELLALSGNSGRLGLTQRDGEGVVVFRQGRIIFAASSSVRESLGNILVCKGIITEGQLRQALHIQRSSDAETRLGTILVELELVSQAVLEDLVTRQTRRVIRELLEWDTGFFRFDRFEVPTLGEVELEASDFLVQDGLAAGELLLDSLAQQLEDDASGSQPSETRSLRSVMGEFRAPSCTGEVSRPVLDFARKLVRRGALFSASPLGFAGLGQFGFDAPGSSGAERVRAIRLPFSEESILGEITARKEPHVGPPAQNPANLEFFRQLGGGLPREALVAPLLVNGRVLMVFYGDNLPGAEPIGSIGGFRQVLIHSALSIERSLLEKRIEHAERLRSSQPAPPIDP